ncbi:hypothetical protein LVJ94_16830 [Pendulispora rubella]|uniref:Lipoprotein n=1 Tax=Pendulispora rubella TaxID=2741070 RepID=A0ABZ2LD93_9BACT
MTMSRLMLCLLPLLAAACGSVSDDTDDPSVLATLHGTIRNPESIARGPGELRVAVVWSVFPKPQGGGGVNAPELHVSQDVAVNPAFPTGFTLDLRVPPPREAVQPIEKTPGLKIAYGTLVAYEDVNGNGRLDLVDPTAVTFVDRIVALNQETILAFLEGTLPDPPQRGTDGSTPRLGFNFLSVDLCLFGTGGSGPCTESKVLWKPIEAEISLALSNAPRFSQLMCQQGPGGSTGLDRTEEHPAGEIPRSSPAGPREKSSCSDGGRVYRRQSCMSRSAGLCGEITESCVTDVYHLEPGVPAPSGWPCTVP